MESLSKSHDDLEAIRSIMEKSTRFLSLSGLSGVIAGITALAGAAVAYFLILHRHPWGEFMASLPGEESAKTGISLITDAGIILMVALGVSFELSRRKARRQGINVWSPASRRMLLNLLVPLVSGGLFIIILMIHGMFTMIVPSMLIFYGLALVNAGKFTYDEIFWLGSCEVITGLAAALLPAYGLLFWILGFGILHIVYGFVMYRKYELCR
jgi:hypothetical protein